ncbi:MAG: hypothetical protein AAGJ94_15645 [Pseudomonadota bacterium]
MLYDEAHKGSVSSARFDPAILALVDDAHILRATAAANWVGSWYRNTFDEPDGYPLTGVLARIAAVPRHRAAVTGALLSGLNDFEGLGAIFKDPRLGKDFDGERFILEAFSQGENEPYLPTAQSLWFPVHEHYAADGAFAVRLLAAGHAYLALMCATELHPPHPSMRNVLKRLTDHANPSIAGQAKSALTRMSR